MRHAWRQQWGWGFVMKHIFLIGVSALALVAASGAYAADLPVYKKAPAPPPYSWAGLYAGIQGGFGWGNATNERPGFDSIAYTPNGAFVGGTLGYNWQFGNWVAGLEGDGAWAHLSASTTSAVPSVSRMPHPTTRRLHASSTIAR